MKLRHANLQFYGKNSLIHPIHVFFFIFSDFVTITFSEEALEICEHTFFQKKLAKSSVTCKILIYLLNNDSSKSDFFMMNLAYDVVLSSFCQTNKPEFFVSCNTKHYKSILCSDCVFDMYFFIKT